MNLNPWFLRINWTPPLFQALQNHWGVSAGGCIAGGQSGAPSAKVCSPAAGENFVFFVSRGWSCESLRGASRRRAANRKSAATAIDMEASQFAIWDHKNKLPGKGIQEAFSRNEGCSGFHVNLHSKRNADFWDSLK